MPQEARRGAVRASEDDALQDEVPAERNVLRPSAPWSLVGPDSDGPATVSLEWVDAQGRVHSLEHRAHAFVPRWRDGAAFVDTEARLWRVRPNGTLQLLDAPVLSLLVVSKDERLLAYVAGRLGDPVDLRVHDGRRIAVWASNLAAIVPLRFDASGERIALLAAVNGGIAGLWVAHRRFGARCLSNCVLQVGMPGWTSRATPLPLSGSDVWFEGDALAWRDEQGEERRVPLRQGG